MFHYVYQIENLINGKTYVGKHSTENLDDGYMGSGKLLNQAIKKHGIENFRKHVVKMCESSEEAFDLEREIVNEQFVADENTYNLKLGGHGGSDWSYVNDNVEFRKEKNRRAAMAMNRTLETDFEYRSRKIERVRLQNIKLHKEGKLKTPDWTGRRHTEVTKQKIGSANSKHQSGTGNSQFGTVWVYDPESLKSKKVVSSDLDKYVEMGWMKGRKMSL
jgi:hypothetical protein